MCRLSRQHVGACPLERVAQVGDWTDAMPLCGGDQTA